VVVILTVQAGSFALEQWGRKSRIPQGFAEIARLNRTYPLGTVFYRREYDETAHRVLLAGRTIITFPPDPLYAYLISPKFLKETLGLHAAFLPCMESWYGENTPEGRFIFLQEGGEPVVSCADMPSLIQG
jgi:hypothetical protein